MAYVPITTLAIQLQAAIPTVYEEGLSYYEAISAIKQKVNECINQLNLTATQTETLIERVTDIIAPQLINDKLQAIIDDGSLAEMIDTQILDSAISNFQGEIDNIKNDFVSVKYFGAVGDGITDDSMAIQAAFNAGNNIIFPKGVYTFKNVVVNRNVNVNFDNSKLIPMHMTETANSFKRMITFSNADFVKIENVFVEGYNPHNEETGEKFNTEGVFSFENIGKVIITNANFKDLTGNWRLASETDWHDRRALCFSAIDVIELIVDKCSFNNIDRDETFWRMFDSNDFSDGKVIVRDCYFHNYVSTFSCFGIVGGTQHIVNNRFKSIETTGSIFNCFGAYVTIDNNQCFDLKCGAMDTCEGYYVKNDSVIVTNNHFSNVDGGGFLKTNTRNLNVSNNYVVAKYLVLALRYLSDGANPIVWSKSESTRYGYESVSICNNVFYNKNVKQAATSAEPAINIYRHNGFDLDNNLRMNDLRIVGNHFKSLRSDEFQPIKIYVVPYSMVVSNNNFDYLGRIEGTTNRLTAIRTYNTKASNVRYVINNNTFNKGNSSIENIDYLHGIMASGTTPEITCLFDGNMCLDTIDFVGVYNLSDIYYGINPGNTQS